jgi:hypothetical protein
MSRSAIYTIFSLTVIFMAVFFLFPILVSVKSAFVGPDGKFTLSYLTEILDNPLYREGLAALPCPWPLRCRLRCWRLVLNFLVNYC